jgi:protein subunit release factor B
MSAPPFPESDEALLAECTVEPFRGSGPGGQHRNKTETGIRLVHVPTGEVAQASERRSRMQNLGVALERLRARLEERFAPPPPPRRATKPSRGARERRHLGKRMRGQVKQGRGRVGDGD